MDKQVKFQIEPLARIFPVLIMMVLILRLITNSEVWLAAMIAFGGAWILGTLWAISLARNIELVREIQSSWTQVGDHLFERITIHNLGWTPATFLRFEDRSNIPQYNPTQLINIERKSLRSWLVRISCQQRGLYTFGPSDIQTGDPFGFYKVLLHFPASSSLLVAPPVIELPLIDIAAGEWIGEGRRKASIFEPTVSATGVREFKPGDRLSAIHWPTSARKDLLFVRTFDSSPSSAWWIFVDLNQKHQFRLNNLSTEEHAVILAASIADRGLNLHQPVGLLTQNSPSTRPRMGESQRNTLMKLLALAKPTHESLAELLTKARAELGRRTSSIIITSDASAVWLGPVLRLQEQGVIPTLILLDPTSYGGESGMEKVIKDLSNHRIRNFLIVPEMINPPIPESKVQSRIESVYKLHSQPSSTIPLRGLEWETFGT